MANTREVFAGLEDANGVGQPNLARTDGGQLASLGNHMGTLVAKDTGGLDVKLNLNASGALIVDDGVNGTVIEDHTIVANGTDVDVAVAVLTATVSYNGIIFRGSCMSSTEFRLIQDDNGAEVVLDSFQVGPGQFTYDGQYGKGLSEITAGAAGTQELILRADKISGNSDFHGYVCAIQIP